jgi:hypothetical protein
MKTWVTSLYNLHNYKKYVFGSTLSESENFLLCVKTKRQADFKYFKRFGALKGLLEQKNVAFNSFVCKLAHSCHKEPNLHTNSLKKLLFRHSVRELTIIAQGFQISSL